MRRSDVGKAHQKSLSSGRFRPYEHEIQTFIDETAVAEFIEGVRGEVLRPDEAGYDNAREIWNTMIDRHPTLIARCAGVADVIAAVNFAQDLLVSVHGGGHNIAGNAVYQKNYDRLVEVKTEYDPGNLFSMNQNVEPGATTD